MTDLILMNADTANEIEGLPSISCEAVPRVGERIHIWQDDLYHQPAKRWNFVVEWIQHDFREMLHGKVVHVVELYVSDGDKVTAPDPAGAG